MSGLPTTHQLRTSATLKKHRIAHMNHPEREAVRLAGIMYLLTIASANFGDFWVRRRLFVLGHPAQTFGKIAASSTLVRAGIAADLVTIAGSVILSVALWAILKSVKKNLALVALFWWLLECSIAAVATLNMLSVSFLLSSWSPSLQGLKSEQLDAFAAVFISVDRSGNRLAGVVFGLGSIVFCYLWFKSRFIPRVLAAWGMVASLLPILAQLAAVILPSFDVPLRRARAGIPIITFEVMLGFWLLLKGVRATDLKREAIGFEPLNAAAANRDRSAQN